MNMLVQNLIQQGYTYTDNQQFQIYAENYKNAQRELKIVKARLHLYMEKLLALTENKPTCNEQFFIQEIKRMGSIEYKNIPLLQAIDLEPYRKTENTYWKVNSL